MTTPARRGGADGLPVTDAAIADIKDMIVRGELRPGDRLPREADLAERLGLSRSSLREAVRALSLVGVLDVRRGDGTYVTSLEPHVLLDSVAFAADIHQDSAVLDLLQVRRVLEAEATAQAALAMPDEEVAALRALLDELGPSPSVEELVASDLELHRRIAAASGNPVLRSLLDTLSGPTQRARVWRGLTQEGAVARTTTEHRWIVDAIAARQPEVARAWATAHVAGVESWLREVVEDRPEGPGAGDRAVP